MLGIEVESKKMMFGKIVTPDEVYHVPKVKGNLVGTPSLVKEPKK